MTRQQALGRMQVAVSAVAIRWLVTMPVDQPGVMDGVWAFNLRAHGQCHRVTVTEADLLHRPTLEAIVRDQLKEAA